ncbi:radical SAM protein [Sulfurimonas aquatica]|uniref:Radical SAM protein n=1 Tax=Sulfurimonas aquatica TaxID=2672570 RepID=A0A975AYC7_9BACT|nr:radical SAM protein [Sulfurimonas aquatica]QSZ40740.1 radical SAM protein [Sulfurimonas aquatica]
MSAHHIEEKKEEVNYNANEIVYSKDWEKYRGADYAEYRANWSKYPKERFVSHFPLNLDIETTDLCNLKCPMCPRTIMDADEDNHIVKSRYIDKETYMDIIDQAVEHGVKAIKLQYLGEPLLHKDIVFQVEYAKKKGIIDVMFNTNAVLMTPELSEQLLEAGIDKVFVSFDAVNPKLYQQQRVGTSIGVVIDNIHEFIKLRNKSYPQTHIRLSMVMYDDPVWQRQFESMKVMWDGLVDSLGYGVFNERHKDLKHEYEKVEGFACEQLFQRMFLKCNGNVTVCCVDGDDEYVVGNWKEEKLIDIWNSPKYQEIRELHTSGNYDKIAMCRKCFLPDLYNKTFK